MSSSIKQSVHLRVVICTLALFPLVYLIYISDKAPAFSMSLISKLSPSNCSCEKRKEQDLTILIWMWPFGTKFDLTCAPFNITGCVLTDDKSLYHKAQAVIFHHRDIPPDLQGMPTEPRPHFQKWVWFNMESPSNSNAIPGLNNLFNLTSNYRRDSDIFTPYASLVPISAEDGLFTHVPRKKRVVCWIVSNWNTGSKRVEYFTELKKHMNISTYGTAFGPYISDEEYFEILKSCKFYLSFENSIHKDYITEKFFRPLEFGAVPVALGPPREQYEAHAPGDAFIHVDDFNSSEELAARLKHLDQNPDEYMAYFEWRNSFKCVNGRFGLEHTCRSCHYLKAQKKFQVFRDLNKWYWG